MAEKSPLHLSLSPTDGTAFVTGASSGIGRALALRLADSGWQVAVTARSAEELERLALEAAESAGAILPFPGDVTEPEAMTELVHRIEHEAGPIALAVLNAGVYLPVDGTALSVEPFHTSFAVNLGGTVNTLVPVIEAMRPRRRGRIALVASVAGYRGLPTSAAYGATKAGLINLAEALKFDLDRLGIAIQVISPGFVDTPATRRNPFPMPHLMDVETAATRIEAGVTRGRSFEIAFPRRFVFQLKLLRLLPYRLYFALVSRATGWRGRKVGGSG